MTLGEQDSGRTISADVGTTVTVRLTENPSTGYRWTVARRAGLEIVDDRNESGAAIGAASLRVLRFRLAEAGQHELRLVHRREWESEDASIGDFRVQLVVT